MQSLCKTVYLTMLSSAFDGSTPSAHIGICAAAHQAPAVQEHDGAAGGHCAGDEGRLRVHLPPLAAGEGLGISPVVSFPGKALAACSWELQVHLIIHMQY
jgi:hypothetical protein